MRTPCATRRSLAVPQIRSVGTVGPLPRRIPSVIVAVPSVTQVTLVGQRESLSTERSEMPSALPAYGAISSATATGREVPNGDGSAGRRCEHAVVSAPTRANGTAHRAVRERKHLMLTSAGASFSSPQSAPRVHNRNQSFLGGAPEDRQVRVLVLRRLLTCAPARNNRECAQPGSEQCDALGLRNRGGRCHNKGHLSDAHKEVAADLIAALEVSENDDVASGTVQRRPSEIEPVVAERAA